MNENVRCPYCQEDRQLEIVMKYKPITRPIDGKIVRNITYLCNTCSKEFDIQVEV